MSKQELVKSLAKKFELSNARAEEVIKYILESITASLSKNKPVTFIGFGTDVPATPL